MTQSLQTLRCLTAPELFAILPEMAEDMDGRPQTDEGVMDFARRLLDGPTPEEAVTCASQMFARRVAIWWGHECLRHVGDHLDQNDLQMMEQAAAWVADPEESLRAAILERAAGQEPRTPGVWLALATGWAGGSVAPADSAPVPPPRFLPGRGVNAAVLTALARVPQTRRKSTLDDFLAMARDLAAPDLD
ncbi:DUF6931 family protein [Salibaculum sp.]|uniref:DUF6931 family protein n=1 Tax=Salibaculum sp. TaxID=2855480 RepID=UPI002B45C846|nr:hypothetical protein [Salibaculum sp.]HKL69611.1 hypothetical protein [Salibaculum sp.]